VGEIREALMMVAYVHDYDELLEDHPDETWEWLEMKGRACFERARKRGNRFQSQYGLTGSPSRQAIVDMAVPGEQYVPPVGEGKGQAQLPNGGWPVVPPYKGQGQAQLPNYSWPAVPPYTGKGRTRLPISKEQREANGPCWFCNTGACVRKSCNKDHRQMSPGEIAAIPTEWCNRNLPEKKGKGEKGTPSGGEDGWQTDQSATGADDAGQYPKRWAKRGSLSPQGPPIVLGGQCIPTAATLTKSMQEREHDDGLAGYNRARHYNRDAVGVILKKVSEKLGVLAINANGNKAVQDPEVAIAIVTKPIQPPLPPPATPPQFPLPLKTTTLLLPRTTTTMQPLLLDEPTVRLNSCPAAGVQDSELMDAIHEDVGPVDEYLEIENALPGCILDLRSSLKKEMRRGIRYHQCRQIPCAPILG
jgi:hypothetical protein